MRNSAVRVGADTTPLGPPLVRVEATRCDGLAATVGGLIRGQSKRRCAWILLVLSFSEDQEEASSAHLGLRTDQRSPQEPEAHGAHRAAGGAASADDPA